MAKARMRRKRVESPEPPLALGLRQEQELGALLPGVLGQDMKAGARSARRVLKMRLRWMPLKTHPRAGRNLLQSRLWPEATLV